MESTNVREIETRDKDEWTREREREKVAAKYVTNGWKETEAGRKKARRVDEANACLISLRIGWSVDPRAGPVIYIASTYHTRT